jgi:hypothetical protein
MSIDSCFTDVPNNRFIQDAVIEEVFKILESSNTEKELQEKINNALEQEVTKGTISLDSKQINAISEKISPALAALTACKIEEGLNGTVTPAQLANSITSFLCNLPKFDLKPFKIKFDFDLDKNIEKIADMFVQIFIDIMFSILSDLLTVVIDLCEFELDIGFGNQVEQALNNTFLNLLGAKIFGGFNLTIDILTNIFEKFDIDFGTGNYIGATGEDCTPAIRTIRPAGEFLGSVSQSLSSKEMCQLLNGNASQSTLNKVREILDFEYPTLSSVLDTEEKIIDLFSTIGNYINPTMCMVEPESFDNLCNFNDLTKVKQQLLEARGLTEAQVKEALDADSKRLKDKIFRIAELISNLKENPDSIFNNVTTNLLCSGGKPGKFKLSDFDEIVYSNKVLANTVYSKINESYLLDSQKTVENNIKFATKRRYIKKIRNSYTRMTADGNSEVINEPTINPLFIQEVEGGNKSFVVVDSDVANRSSRLNKTTIENFPSPSDDYYFGDYSKILETPKAHAELYSTDTDYIVGIVVDYKQRINPLSSSVSEEEANSSFSKEQYGLQYGVNTNNNLVANAYKSYKIDSLTELVLKNPNTPAGFLTENSLININENSSTLFDLEKFNNVKFEINGEFRNLNQQELDSVESAKKFFSNFEQSEGPFRPVSTEIKSIVDDILETTDIILNGRSTQEQVFVELAKDSFTTTEEAYAAHPHFALALSEKLHNFNLSALQKSDYESFSDLYFTEGLLRVKYEKDQYLNKFLNDPCSLTLESFETDISPAASALIGEMTRLFIKVHVIKNVIKNMAFLYHFDPYELVKHDDSFIEFTLQTLKNEIEDFTSRRQDFTSVMNIEINSKFKTEYEINDYSIYDPITNQEYNNDFEDFSIDFKYRYFIKKEFMGLLKSFRSAFFMLKRQQPATFDNFMVSTMITDDINPQGFNLVACYLDDKREKLRGGISLSANKEDRAYAAIFIVMNQEGRYYEQLVSSIKLQNNQEFYEVRDELVARLNTNDKYKILTHFCFNSSKYLSLNHINEVMVYAKNSYESISIFKITSKTIRDLIFQLLATTNPKAEDNNCYTSTDAANNALNLPDFDYLKELLARFIVEAPLTIIKLLAERFDPNISVTNQIRNLVEIGASAAAGQKVDLPILPFVLALWPVNWPTLWSYGPPITASMGIPYLIIDTIQSSIALANIKLKRIDLLTKYKLDFPKDDNIENPYPSEC